MAAFLIMPSSFNPTLVRLRPQLETIRVAQLNRFNPTLVRLRQSPPGLRLGLEISFQSHAGSIEAPHNLRVAPDL